MALATTTTMPKLDSCTAEMQSCNNKDVPPGPYKLPPRPENAPREEVELETSKESQADNNSSINDGQDGDCKENKATTTRSTVSGPLKSPIRKRLGCRRVEDDLITSDDEGEEDGEEEDNALRRKLFFTSPRLMEPDESLFPVNHSPYKSSDERWKHISDQAGSHRQDGTVITIGRKITPMALRVGMTKQAAGRVRALNLWLDHDKDTLPEWLDVIANTFTSLEHLTLTEDVFPGEDEMAVSARMRRLYVLYRLPYLKSIDDQIVSKEERRLARPNETDPNGDKVIQSQWSSLFENSSHSRKEIGPDEVANEDTSESAPTQQQRLAHEMPVEIIHDRFSHGVVNDGIYGDENDGLGQIPRIPANFSNVSTRTAKEVGVEINQELAAKFAELNHNTTATTSTTMSETTGLEFDEVLDDELAGVAMLSDLAASSEEIDAPESRDLHDLSTSISGEDTDEASANVNLDKQEIMMEGGSDNEKAVEVDMDSPRNYDVPTIENLQGQKKGVRSQVIDTEDNSIELVSVASTDLEWTAACGVLSFRTDRSCAPRLRMPFSRNRKVSASDADAAVRAIRQAKVKVRNRQREKETGSRKPCTPVARNDDAATPQVAGCCTFGTTKKSTFFPEKNNSNQASSSISANKQLPPSKSLSSPFPMQFRERRQTPPRTQLVVKTSESTDSTKSRDSRESPMSREMETISVPLQSINSVSSSSPRSRDHKKPKAAKGDLPPPCPTGSRRMVPMHGVSQAHKSKRQQRQMKRTKENARSTSVMDLEDDDEEEEVVEDDEILLARSSDDDEYS